MRSKFGCRTPVAYLTDNYGVTLCFVLYTIFFRGWAESWRFFRRFPPQEKLTDFTLRISVTHPAHFLTVLSGRGECRIKTTRKCFFGLHRVCCFGRVWSLAGVSKVPPAQSVRQTLTAIFPRPLHLNQANTDIHFMCKGISFPTCTGQAERPPPGNWRNRFLLTQIVDWELESNKINEVII